MLRRALPMFGLALLLGTPLGVGVYTFIYAKGWSYLTDNPSTCANCHIMQEQYDGWVHASHRFKIGCNDCHTPSSFTGKWLTKAYNGFWHSYYFTKGDFPQPIQITPRSLAITEQRCRDCHQSIVSAMDHGGAQEARSCTRCHPNVGHLH